MSWADVTRREEREAPAAGGVATSLAELTRLRREAKGLVLGRARQARAALAGPYASVYRGRGLEFDEVRAYQPGDDVRSIDWRVTARTGRVHSKVFRDDRERPFWLMLDSGPSMRFGTRGAFKSVAAARAAALVSWAAHGAGDPIGALVVSPESVRVFAPRAREHQLFALLAAMAAATAAPGDTAALSMAGCFRRLRQSARPGSRVFVLSDFYDLGGEAREDLRALAGRCDVSCVLVHDPIEAEAPPPGCYRVSDGRGVRAISTHDPHWRQEYAARFAARRDVLARLARENRIELVSLRTDDDPVATLAALRPARPTQADEETH